MPDHNLADALIIEFMDNRTRQICIDETTHFYQKNAKSFSETRASAWSGWKRLLPYIKTLDSPISVFDLGCGNMRFEKFLCEQNLDIKFATCIDNCPALIPKKLQSFISYAENNIYQLIGNKPKAKHNCSVAFGVLHHIPTFDERVKLLEYLIDSTNDGGIIAVSCWNFLNSEKLKNKAIETTRIAESVLDVNLIDESDYFLNWQDDYTTFRYCHNFTEKECRQLIYKVSDYAELIDLYRADGKYDNLNLHMVFRKR